MIGPDFLRPGLENNYWNTQAEMSRNQPITTFDSGPQLGTVSLPNIPQIYESNNVGPGHIAAENEFRRLQKDAFDYESSLAQEGLNLLKTRHEPDFSYQEKAVGLAKDYLKETQLATGIVYKSPEPIMPIYESPKPSLMEESISRIYAERERQ